MATGGRGRLWGGHVEKLELRSEDRPTDHLFPAPVAYVLKHTIIAKRMRSPRATTIHKYLRTWSDIQNLSIEIGMHG